MIKWAATKLKRTWRGLGAKLRKWGYGIGAAVMLPLVGVGLWGGVSPLGALEGSALAPFFAAAGWVSLTLLVASWFLHWWRRSSNDLTVTWDPKGEVLRLEGDRIDQSIAVRDIESAVFIPNAWGYTEGQLVIQTTQGTEYRLAMSQLPARSLLDETKLGARHRNSHFRSQPLDQLGCWLFTAFQLFPATCAAFESEPLTSVADYLTRLLLPGVNAAPGLWRSLALLLVCMVGVDLWRLLRPRAGKSVVLGADGIRFKRMFRRRFIAYADIESWELKGLERREFNKALVDAWGDVLVLRTKSGEVFQLSLAGTELPRAVHERLQVVFEERGQILMPQLNREGRSDEEWREALRALVAHQGEYRRATVPRERVKEILQDPAAPPEQRLGAAVALVEAADREAHRILVRVSDGVADPELRGPLVKLAKEAEEAHGVEVESTSAVGEQEESQ